MAWGDRDLLWFVISARVCKTLAIYLVNCEHNANQCKIWVTGEYGIGNEHEALPSNCKQSTSSAMFWWPVHGGCVSMASHLSLVCANIVREWRVDGKHCEGSSSDPWTWRYNAIELQENCVARRMVVNPHKQLRPVTWSWSFYMPDPGISGQFTSGLPRCTT